MERKICVNIDALKDKRYKDTIAVSIRSCMPTKLFIILWIIKNQQIKSTYT